MRSRRGSGQSGPGRAPLPLPQPSFWSHVRSIRRWQPCVSTSLMSKCDIKGREAGRSGSLSFLGFPLIISYAGQMLRELPSTTATTTTAPSCSPHVTPSASETFTLICSPNHQTFRAFFLLLSMFQCSNKKKTKNKNRRTTCTDRATQIHTFFLAFSLLRLFAWGEGSSSSTALCDLFKKKKGRRKRTRRGRRRKEEEERGKKKKKKKQKKKGKKRTGGLWKSLTSAGNLSTLNFTDYAQRNPLQTHFIP